MLRVHIPGPKKKRFLILTSNSNFWRTIFEPLPQIRKVEQASFLHLAPLCILMHHHDDHHPSFMIMKHCKSCMIVHQHASWSSTMMHRHVSWWLVNIDKHLLSFFSLGDALWTMTDEKPPYGGFSFVLVHKASPSEEKLSKCLSIGHCQSLELAVLNNCNV